MAAISEEPEEYPTKDDLIRAGVLAVVTGVFGIALTYAHFVRP